MNIPVLLDTDLGSDIDDAVCLAYLLAQPRCELLGITTVSGDVQQRAEIASALCAAAGKDTPIYAGAREPLLIAQRQTEVPQAAALPRWPHRVGFAEGQAVEFMRQTIRQRPGEVTLLAIGPLTNVALLFAVDPEIPALLKELVLMCGYFNPPTPQAEWNALIDPHATRMVYRAAPPRHRSVGLDVTLRVTLPPDEVRRRFQAPLLRPVRDFAEVWFAQARDMVFHDPLAAVSIFDDDVCQFERGVVDVDESDGRTLWTPGAGPHETARAVDAPRFFEDYFGVF